MDDYKWVINLMFQPTFGIEINFSRGLNACQAEYAARKFKSHWRVGTQIMMDVGILDNATWMYFFIPRAYTNSAQLARLPQIYLALSYLC